MTDRNLLQQAIKASGLKKSYLAERCGLSRTGFSLCLNGRAEFKESQMHVLSAELKLTPEQSAAIFFAQSGV